jgi:DNA replication licensing factor MCM7
MGHIPRSMTVHFTESQVRTVSPGETVVVSGIILPVPYTGFQAMRAGESVY